MAQQRLASPQVPLNPNSGQGALATRMVTLGGVPVAILAAAATAYLGATGLWYLAVAVIASVPLAFVLHRYPLSVIMIWLLVMPFLVDDAGGTLRKIFWITHRALPVIALLVIVASSRLGFREKQLPRLGWPELAMAAYVVFTLLSIGYLSQSDRALYDLYDRVVIPMALYLVVRLEEPDERDLRRFVPVVLFVLLSQAAVGWLGWLAPQALPGDWLDRAGTRTTGSLREVSVYGTTMVFAGALVLHAGWHAHRRTRRVILFAAAILAGVMVFMTFSRASWLAGLVAFAAISYAYRGVLRRTLIVVVPLLALSIVLSGATQFVEYADRRFLSDASEESALSRLPVAYAALNMVQERPIWGFGFGNFDLFDRQYQEAIPGLVVPEKDHASHNLYLTVLAEQGVSGFFVFVAPMLFWLAMAIPAARRLPKEGIRSRQFLIGLWAIVASFVVVNNFSNMRVSFGLGLWWIALGLVAAVTTTALRPGPPSPRAPGSESAADRVSAQIPSPAELRAIASRHHDHDA